MKMISSAFKVILGAGIAIGMSTGVIAAPKSKLIDSKWNATGSADFDHSAWDDFTGKYITTDGTGLNRVSYGSVSDADRTALDGYLNALQSADPTSLSKDAQMAYWINLYNAATVDVILDHYPVKSIRKIGGGVFSSGPWDEEILTINGSTLTLNDIEHGILRPIWDDPRIHYAVNCASVGCPNLAKKAYTAGNLEQMLDQAAVDYINNPRGATVKNGKLHVSSIFEWYKVDFGNNDAGVIAHMKQYANADTLAALGSIGKISNDFYDWDLNE